VPARAVKLAKGFPHRREEFGQLGAEKTGWSAAGLALCRFQMVAKRAAVALRLRQFQGMARER